jgi:hypothetical protein
VESPTPTAASAGSPAAAPSRAATTTAPTLRAGPHSFVADVDLPGGSVQDRQDDDSSTSEGWNYSAPYDDIVAFLRAQFATGRQYDAHGATWWKGLPPCYYAHHTPPPKGWSSVTPGGISLTYWNWADGVNWLDVTVYGPHGGKPGTMSISRGSDPSVGVLELLPRLANYHTSAPWSFWAGRRTC